MTVDSVVKSAAQDLDDLVRQSLAKKGVPETEREKAYLKSMVKDMEDQIMSWYKSRGYRPTRNRDFLTGSPGSIERERPGVTVMDQTLGMSLRRSMRSLG